MKTSKLTAFLLLASLGVAVAGCADKAASPSSMGPMPTAPPAGSPYAATASDLTPDAFVAKLQALPHADRSAFVSSHASVMGQIMSGPDSPAKQKLMTIISQH